MVEAVYNPRKPKASPLYQCISEHFSEFESVYEVRYQDKFGILRHVVREVVYKYLGCGDLRKGFARIKCKDCKHEILLAFSCKGRYFCPSCHQKRVLMFGEWITEKILYPLPHRQYVFTLPKMLRPYFRFDRKLLGKLSQCAYQSLKEFFQTTLNRKEAMPRGGDLDPNLRRPGQFSPPPALSRHRRLLYAQRLVLRSARNRRKEAGKPFSPQGPKASAQREKDQRGAGQKGSSPGKIPVSAFTIRSKLEAGTAGAGKAWPSISSSAHFLWRK
jgi:hypothetical protein